MVIFFENSCDMEEIFVCPEKSRSYTVKMPNPSFKGLSTDSRLPFHGFPLQTKIHFNIFGSDAIIFLMYYTLFLKMHKNKNVN